jgi:hypothetical protein
MGPVRKSLVEHRLEVVEGGVMACDIGSKPKMLL